jgi:hypothetical protein
MEVTPLKRGVVVAIDIEKIGCKLNHPVVSVGFVVGADRELIEKTRISIQLGDTSQWQDDDEFKRCKREFWDNQGGLLELLQKEASPAKDALKRIADYIDSLYERFEIRRWLSDNPAFDLGHLDHQLVGTRPYPIRHSPNGSYTSVVDPTEQYKGLPPSYQRKIDVELKAFWASGDRSKHMPDDDAEGIWRTYILVHDARDQLRSGHECYSCS